jgi:hypothetical protein
MEWRYERSIRKPASTPVGVMTGFLTPEAGPVTRVKDRPKDNISMKTLKITRLRKCVGMEKYKGWKDYLNDQGDVDGDGRRWRVEV